MRLTCPNCKAQYEVDDAVIPDNGRDVQCSACGHTWYQYPIGLSRAPRPPAPEAGEAPGGVAAPLADETTADSAGADEHPGDDAESLAPRPAAPRVEQSVLDVLREEAEREITERRRSSAPIETQGDLGLVSRPRSRARPARETGRDGEHNTGREADAGHNDTAPDDHEASTRAGASRRNLLPDIEELSSTLEPGREPRRKGASETALPPTDEDERRGFRQGFILILIVAIMLAGLYVLAPQIAARVPALAAALEGYVALVDSLHMTLRGFIDNLIAGMRGEG